MRLVERYRLKQRFYVRGDSLRCGARRVAFDHLALAANQKLREVPLDAFAQGSRRGVLEVLKQRIGAAAVDLDLAEHGEAHAIVELAKRHDLVLAARVLAAKLIAGEAQHREAPIPVTLIQRFQPRELRCESAARGGVHDQQNMAPIILQRVVLTRRVFGGEAENRIAHSSSTNRRQVAGASVAGVLRAVCAARGG